MTGSDRSGGKRWPEAERRQGERRSGRERRERPAAPPQAGERREGQRRQGKDRRDETAWAAVPVELPPAPDRVNEDLVAAAVAARANAHARYSNFRVGAALETDEGAIVSGCNIENATYGLTLCAERVALVKALSDGHGVFTRIAVVADSEQLTPPCGPCRQLLWEYCGDIEVVLANLAGARASHRLSALLPMPFDNRLL